MVEVKEFGNGSVLIEVKKFENQKELVKLLLNNNFIVPYFLSSQDMEDNDIFLTKNNNNELNMNIYPYNVVDYKLKNKFIKSNNDNSAYLLVDNILLSNNKKEQLNILKAMNFTSQDEKDAELKWSLETIAKTMREGK